ncbi:MAG: inositol monophosphatase [Deltaproteobacteria bacterium]|nr:inositol monophosphatase [Deltaproteobacteria bacterium]
MTDRLQTVIAVARDAGRLALDLRHDLRVETKPDGSIVTNADVAVQQHIALALGAAFPDFAIVGEEGGLGGGDLSGPTFAVDPIDGTDSYHRGFVHFGVSIGLVENGRCTLGVFFNPALDLLYAADAGVAYLNGEPLPRLVDRGLGEGRLLLAPSNFHRYYTTTFTGKIRGYGSVAQHLCYVASGQAAAALAFRSHIWDLAASLAILDAVDGRYLDLNGRPFDPAPTLNGEKIIDAYLAAPADCWGEMAAHIAPRPRP